MTKPLKRKTAHDRHQSTRDAFGLKSTSVLLPPNTDMANQIRDASNFMARSVTLISKICAENGIAPSSIRKAYAEVTPSIAILGYGDQFLSLSAFLVGINSSQLLKLIVRAEEIEANLQGQFPERRAADRPEGLPPMDFTVPAATATPTAHTSVPNPQVPNPRSAVDVAQLLRDAPSGPNRPGQPSTPKPDGSHLLPGVS